MFLFVFVFFACAGIHQIVHLNRPVFVVQLFESEIATIHVPP